MTFWQVVLCARETHLPNEWQLKGGRNGESSGEQRPTVKTHNEKQALIYDLIGRRHRDRAFPQHGLYAKPSRTRRYDTRLFNRRVDDVPRHAMSR